LADEQIRAALVRLRNGDIDGLSILVEEYQVQATRIAFLITQDKAQAEDVVQSAFLRVYERIHQFDMQRDFAPWFFRIVANAAVQTAQREQRQVSLENESGISLAEILPDSLPSPDEQAERSELREAVWEALGQLSPKQRAAMVLHYYLDMKEGELAEETDSKPGTVRWRLHTGREHLRVLLGRFKNLVSTEVES